MKKLGDILLLDVIILIASTIFGAGGFCTVLIVEIFYTLGWICTKL